MWNPEALWNHSTGLYRKSEMTLCTRDTFRVDRATFGSSSSGSIQGYQLLNWSAGIDANTTKELCQWAPTRLLSRDLSSWSVHAFPLQENRICIGRTFVAGYDYSQRGSPNVVSTFVVLDQAQWEAYDFDALAVFYTAMSLGAMRLPAYYSLGNVDRVELPATLPMTSEFYSRIDADANSESQPQPPLSEVADRIREGNRIALVGIERPLSYAARLIEQLDVSSRRRFCFTTGLPLSAYRPFQLHFLDAASYNRQHLLVSTMTDAVYGG